VTLGPGVRPSVSHRRWTPAWDVLLVVLVTALQLVGPRAGSPVRTPDLLAGPGGSALGVVAALVGGAVLLWRRSRPRGVLAVCVAAYGVNAVIVPGVPPYAGWLALYAAGVYRRPAAWAGYTVAAGAITLVAVFAACALVYPKTAGELVLLIAVTVTVALAGTLVRSRRAQLGALRDRAAALERERVSAAARAAAEERLRIARDVHDLVGHGLSSIAVQSSTARLALDAGRIETARTALSAVESSSRAALGEMRQLLGVLRAVDADDYGSSPGLGDLRGLVGTMRRQGVAVTLRPGELGDVPDAVSLAAYRVVQEALTNVVKHGGGNRVTVEVGTSGGAVLVAVEDYADQPAPQASQAPPPGDAGQPTPLGERVGGTGLAGMRERVAGFGGEVSAGPAGDHPGWRVRARIPYGEDDAG
jgi:signal transduction histidine kinase